MAETNFPARDVSKSTPIADDEFPRFSWPHMYLGALGFAISLYAFLIHQKIKAGGESGCGFTETINCDKVLASQYGSLFGIPLGAFGMLYFVVVILTAITTNRNSTPRAETAQRLVIASLGLLATFALSYISYVIIKAACPICMATHATIIATFAVSLWQFLKARKAPLGSTSPESTPPQSAPS
jgi:uncharacterized membrane protein